mmetsp:Transcript_19296/g.48534  ORF Transcript_19296/g.48534 Transcript_19296/m.48534 type:complete len:219 (+) Transcript_19296:1190-1846(+)
MCVAQAEGLQVAQRREAAQTLVGHIKLLQVEEVEVLQAGEGSQGGHSRGCDGVAASQGEVLESLKRGERRAAGICDVEPHQVEAGQPGERAGNGGDAGVRDAGRAELQPAQAEARQARQRTERVERCVCDSRVGVAEVQQREGGQSPEAGQAAHTRLGHQLAAAQVEVGQALGEWAQRAKSGVRHLQAPGHLDAGQLAQSRELAEPHVRHLHAAADVD